jgi:hypothetical protein
LAFPYKAIGLRGSSPPKVSLIAYISNDSVIISISQGFDIVRESASQIHPERYRNVMYEQSPPHTHTHGLASCIPAIGHLAPTHRYKPMTCEWAHRRTEDYTERTGNVKTTCPCKSARASRASTHARMRGRESMYPVAALFTGERSDRQLHGSHPHSTCPRDSHTSRVHVRIAGQ